MTSDSSGDGATVMPLGWSLRRHPHRQERFRVGCYLEAGDIFPISTQRDSTLKKEPEMSLLTDMLSMLSAESDISLGGEFPATAVCIDRAPSNRLGQGLSTTPARRCHDHLTLSEIPPPAPDRFAHSEANCLTWQAGGGQDSKCERQAIQGGRTVVVHREVDMFVQTSRSHHPNLAILRGRRNQRTSLAGRTPSPEAPRLGT